LDKDQLTEIHSRMTEDANSYSKQLVVYTKLASIYQTNRSLLEDVLPQVNPDSELSTYLSDLHEAERNRAKLLVDYNPSNLLVLRVQSLIDTLDMQISNRVDGIMAGLDTQLTATQQDLLNLSNEVETAKEQDFENTLKYQPYYAFDVHPAAVQSKNGPDRL
jgi:hypothetical protein